MINDVTFLLDESFSRLAEVARIQKEMDQPDWSATPAQQRSERMNHLHSVTGQAKSYLSLAKSTMKLLIKFTKETVKPFMTPEIVNRLAAMLDYNLTTLVGPKCTELKVKDKDKLKFDPRELLSDLLQIYLNLCAEDDFIAAIAKDERSFDPATFQRATKIARERSLKPEADIEKITQLTLNASATKERLDLEEDTADLPDEFLGERKPLHRVMCTDAVLKIPLFSQS
jgi:ubiquitin conjugation factor E4 B